MEPSNDDVITLRVGKDLKAAFNDMVEKNRTTRAVMFQTLIDKYKASKQAKKFIDLQKAHERLAATCDNLQQQLFDVFTTYNDALDAIQPTGNEIYGTAIRLTFPYRPRYDQQLLLFIYSEVAAYKVTICYRGKDSVVLSVETI